MMRPLLPACLTHLQKCLHFIGDALALSPGGDERPISETLHGIIEACDKYSDERERKLADILEEMKRGLRTPGGAGLGERISRMETETRVRTRIFEADAPRI